MSQCQGQEQVIVVVPAWRTNNGSDEIIGIVSGGVLPATAVDTPGWFTKVALFKDWMTSVIGTSVGVNDIDISLRNINFGISSEELKIYFAKAENEEYTVELINISGAVVSSKKILNSVNSTHSMNVSWLPTGMYIAKLTDNRGRYLSKKIFKY